MLQAAIMLAFQCYCLIFILKKVETPFVWSLYINCVKHYISKLITHVPPRNSKRWMVFKAERTAAALSWCAYCRLHTYLTPDSGGDKTWPAAEVTVQYVFVFERLLLDTLKEVHVTKHITY